MNSIQTTLFAKATLGCPSWQCTCVRGLSPGFIKDVAVIAGCTSTFIVLISADTFLFHRVHALGLSKGSGSGSLCLLKFVICEIEPYARQSIARRDKQ